MFDFKDKMTSDQIMQVAMQDGLPPLRVAINANGYRSSNKFWCSAEEMLCVKLNYESCVVVHRLKRLVGNGGVAKIRNLYDAIRKVKPFVGRVGMFSDLRNNILPTLQDAGIICLIGVNIYVHPALAGMDERDAYTWCNQWRTDAQQKETIFGYDADEVRKSIDFYRKAKSLLNGK